ncbi:MAG TPA: hypothetical protein VMH81_21285 [Bryobacteraceae bacterium]|nr:hypothetical protein [Bryobacteraceae bacterium]
MEMLLMGACLSVFGLAVACLAFGAATREPEQTAAAAPAVPKTEVKAAVRPARFFGDRPVLPAYSDVPIEALLLQIENHVRLEHAAAESFLESPNASLLHARTISSLVN